MVTDLGRSVLSATPDRVAPLLLGATLRTTSSRGTVALRITEVEAYGGVGEDAASHAFNGSTRRNAVMFDKPGLLYMYFVYGMHWCANVVCGPQGSGSAVLLRAGTVIEGLAIARQRRPKTRYDRDLARGPANLARTLAIGGDDNGTDLLRPNAATRLTAAPTRETPAEVAVGPRIGIRRETERPWRWWIVGEPSVSRTPSG